MRTDVFRANKNKISQIEWFATILLFDYPKGHHVHMLALCSDLALHRMNLGDRIVINRRNIFNNSLLCWATLKFLAADFIPPILLRYSYIDSKYSSPFSVQLARRVLKLVCTKSLKFEKTDASYFFFVFLYQGIKIFETKK